MFSERAYAMDAYRWVSRRKTQFTPLARCPSFPVSLLGLLHCELLAMGIPGRIDQQTNTLDLIVGHTDGHPVGVDGESQHCLYRSNVEFFPLVHG